MAVIYSYPQVSTVDGTELLICSQTSSNNATRSMTTAAFGAYISAAYGPGGSIYLANGTLSGDRTLVGGGNSLTFSGLSLFTVASPVELGSTFKLTTGASLNHVLTSDASGNAAWAAPAAGSFIGLTDTPLVWHGHAAGQPVTINPTLDGLVFATSLEAAHGGTGINTYAVGDILYADSVSTLTKLVAGTDTHVLTLAAGVPTWAAPTTGTVTSVTGTTPIASSGGATPAISISAATTSVAGSMSGADKTKLDGIAAAAQPGIVTTLTTTGSGVATLVGSTLNVPTPSGGTGTVTSITTAADSGSGTAITTSGTFTFSGGTYATTSVSGTTVTINADNLYSTDGTISGSRTITNASNLRFTGTGLATTTTFDNKAGYGFTNNASITVGGSAVVQIDSTTKGFLPPRMTTAQMNAIGTPVEGLLVWDETTSDFKGYDGDNWVYLGGKLEQVYGIYTFDLTGNTDNLGNSGANTTPTITTTIHNVTNIYRVDPDGVNHEISGILAPPTGVNRVIHISNVHVTNDIKFMDDNSGTAANGILLRDSADKSIKGNETASFWYDHVVSRWKVFNRVG